MRTFREWLLVEANTLNARSGIALSWYNEKEELVEYKVPVAIDLLASFVFSHMDTNSNKKPVIDWFRTVFLKWAISKGDNSDFSMSTYHFINEILIDWAFTGEYPNSGFNNKLIPSKKRYSDRPNDKRFVNDVMSRLPKYAKESIVLFPFGVEAAMETAADNDSFNFGGVIDYFRTIQDQPVYQRLQNMSVPQVMKKAEELQKKVGSYQEKEGIDVKTIMKFPDGMKIVQLLTPIALDQESARCKHCVGKGTYDHKIKNNTSQIYSLRKNDESFGTIEISNGKVLQIKGHENKELNSHLMTYALKFIDSLNA